MTVPTRRASALARARAELGSAVLTDHPLAPLTTYRVGGPAAIFAAPADLDQLRTLCDVARRHDVPVLVIGRGSNLLVADRGFDGLVISLSAMPSQLDIRPDSAERIDVIVDGAAALPVVARRLAAAAVSGFEWAVGVPGSIGGAVRMNAGGHGSDMSAVVAGIHRFNVRSGHHGWVPVEQLGLRFRGSNLTDDDIVVDARLILRHGDRAVAEQQLSEIVRWRREHQPGGQNAGSVFVNPIPGHLASAQLIDGLGLRGMRIGTAEVSPKHANFIQADEGGSADDVHAVIEAVRRRVLERTGIALRCEVRLVGFEPVELAA